jgi:hypothetical protein
MLKKFNQLLSSRNSVALSVAAVLALLAAGCGSTPYQASPSSGSSPFSISGHVQGGNNPIAYGTVTLYATAANATGNANGIYTGGHATILGQTTTGIGGGFTITGATACSAPNQTYIVISGGNPGGGAANSNILLMALSGPCGAINSFTWVNEITTVATAYALSSFTQITSTCTSGSYTASPCVNVTSSPTNYDGLYSAGSYAGVGSTAAGMGLTHAIANAYNLANMKTGTANSTTLLADLVTAGPGTVPATEINSLANILQVCVNSSGGAATANSTSSAASFTNTTSPTASTQSVYTLTALPNSTTGVNGTLSVSLNGGTAFTANLTGTTSASSIASAINAISGFNNAVAVIKTNATTGSATSGAGFSITGFTPTTGATGTVTVTLAGTSLGPQTISGSTPAAIVANINANTAFSGATPLITFSTPTASSSSAYSTSTLSGFNTATGLNGNISIAVGGGTANVYTISGSTTPATFVSAFNAAVPTSVAQAAVSGTGVVITGAVKASGNTLSFPSNTLVSTGSVITAALSGLAGPVVTGPSGNTLTVTNTLVGTAGTNTLIASAKGPTSVIITGPTGNNTLSFTGSSLTVTPPTVSDGSNCGALFNATPSLTGATPTNTLQAMLNLAKNPYPGSANMTAIWGLLPGSSAAFSPNLTASPGDWTMAVVYTAAQTGIVFPLWLATDANDNMYLENTSAASSTYTKILALTSSGALISPTAGWVPSNSTTSKTPRGIALDSIGNIWIADDGVNLLNQYSATNGAFLSSYQRGSADTSLYAVAVDKLNNVWLSNLFTANGNIDELAYSAGTSTGGTYAYATGGTNSNGTLEQATNAPYGFAVDANQNIWSAGYYSSGYTVGTVANQTPTAAATYTANSMLNTTVGATGVDPFSVAIDSSGNAWATLYGNASIVEVTPGAVNGNGVITQPTVGSPITSPGFSTPEGMVMDGNNTLWIADNGNSTEGLLAYNTGSSTAIAPPNGFKSCLVVGTICGATTAAAIYDPRYPAVDSTGSVWAAITTGGVTQIIGTAAPTWPLLATGKPGVMP